MSSIDERIVDMRFNNGEFEKGIKESMKSLEDLKKALELDKQTQSLNNLEKAVSSMNFQQLSNNVEQLTNRFSNLGIVGMTALQNIANKITDTVMATAKSLTLSQIFEGKGKYEQKLESVQAIKAATGQSVENTPTGQATAFRIWQRPSVSSFRKVSISTPLRWLWKVSAMLRQTLARRSRTPMSQCTILPRRSPLAK